MTYTASYDSSDLPNKQKVSAFCFGNIHRFGRKNRRGTQRQHCAPCWRIDTGPHCQHLPRSSPESIKYLVSDDLAKEFFQAMSEGGMRTGTI